MRDPYGDWDDLPEDDGDDATGSEEEPLEKAGRDAKKGAKKSSGLLSFLAELPVLVLVALVVAVIIKTFLIQAFYIPSGSMIPTLMINDRVMVNKLAFRFGEPERYDVIVFDSPFAPTDPQEPLIGRVFRTVKESLGIQTATVADDLIKRVIALPGEEIEIYDGVVHIDGRAIDEPYLVPNTPMPDFGPEAVPDGFVFVMGDNRGSSNDSRVFGPIPIDTIVGRAFVRVWPVDRWGGL